MGHLAEPDPEVGARLRKVLDRFLPKERDRALFGLLSSENA